MLAKIVTYTLLGISLSVDAFAVTVGEGLSCPVNRLKNALWHAAYFGLFQALMPMAGFYLAGTVSDKITAFGPYISFFLLVLIGGKMLVDTFRKKSGGKSEDYGLFSHPKAIVLAVATSIDALAVGVSFAFTESSVFLPCAIIGICTFVICSLGGLLCSKLPKNSGRAAGILGGLVLIGIGAKLLIEGVFLV